jgi:hypothetical protein
MKVGFNVGSAGSGGSETKCKISAALVPIYRFPSNKISASASWPRRGWLAPDEAFRGMLPQRLHYTVRTYPRAQRK